MTDRKILYPEKAKGKGGGVRRVFPAILLWAAVVWSCLPGSPAGAEELPGQTPAAETGALTGSPEPAGAAEAPGQEENRDLHEPESPAAPEEDDRGPAEGAAPPGCGEIPEEGPGESPETPVAVSAEEAAETEDTEELSGEELQEEPPEETAPEEAEGDGTAGEEETVPRLILEIRGNGSRAELKGDAGVPEGTEIRVDRIGRSGETDPERLACFAEVDKAYSAYRGAEVRTGALYELVFIRNGGRLIPEISLGDIPVICTFADDPEGEESVLILFRGEGEGGRVYEAVFLKEGAVATVRIKDSAPDLSPGEEEETPFQDSWGEEYTLKATADRSGWSFRDENGEDIVFSAGDEGTCARIRSGRAVAFCCSGEDAAEQGWILTESATGELIVPERSDSGDGSGRPVYTFIMPAADVQADPDTGIRLSSDGDDGPSDSLAPGAAGPPEDLPAVAPTDADTDFGPYTVLILLGAGLLILSGSGATGRSSFRRGSREEERPASE